MISICKVFSFEAAHNLPDHLGKCRNQHGHSYRLEVEVSGPIQKEGSSNGMIMDFGDLKKIIEEHITSIYDHSNLNSFYPVPTAEIMVRSIGAILFQALPKGICLERVRLYETANAYAEWRKS